MMPAEWTYDAACDATTAELFFPPPVQGGGRSEANYYDAALAICAVCPVTAECLAFWRSLPAEQRQHGVWAGLVPGAARATLLEPTCRTCSADRAPDSFYCAPCRDARHHDQKHDYDRRKRRRPSRAKARVRP